ncbi:MAG: 2-keto-4-pentenoate hydratase [Methanocella sp.]
MADDRGLEPGLTALAETLSTALRTGRPVDLNPELTQLDDVQAYAIQWANIAARGGGVVGYKIGWADPAARAAAGVPEPIFGRYQAEDLVPEGGTTRPEGLIRASVEGEFTVIVEREIGGAALDAATVRAHCRLALGFDLFDSRLVGGAANWQAAAADNCGAGRAVVGPPRIPLPTGEELAGLELTLTCDGRVVGSGTGRKIDDPAETVAWLARKLSEEGESLHPGQFILLGAVAGPVPMGERGSWEGRALGLGSVRVQVVT